MALPVLYIVSCDVPGVVLGAAFTLWTRWSTVPKELKAWQGQKTTTTTKPETDI